MVRVMKKKKVQPTLRLPTQKSCPRTGMEEYSLIIYGEKKIGKTSLASMFEEAFFFMFEPGGKALSLYQEPMPDWKTFRRYMRLLKNTKRFTNVVVDTVDIAYRRCEKFICEKLAIEHPSELEWGRGWGALRDEFTDAFVELNQGFRGLIMLSHVAEREIKKRGGTTETRILSSMPNSAKDILEGMTDMWFYFCYDDAGKRVLRLESDGNIACGHRLPNNFVGINTVPMGSSPQEGYRNFIGAFNNERPWLKGGTTKPPQRRRRVVRVR